MTRADWIMVGESNGSPYVSIEHPTLRDIHGDPMLHREWGFTKIEAVASALSWIEKTREEL